MAALTTTYSGLAALPAARAGTLPWTPELESAAAALQPALAAAEPAEALAAVAAKGERRLRQMLDGIRAYQRHDYRRAPSSGTVFWREGTTRLLAYGDAAGIPALFVPSLINRYYVLDLMEDRSLLRWLAGNGVCAMVVDWDAPGEEERHFDLSDYIAGRLARALRAAAAHAGAPVHLVGYCMGGNLALAQAPRQPEDVRSLALLATPWDFHAERASTAALLAIIEPQLELLLRAFGELPVDILQSLFAGLDPNLAARKFRRFADLKPNSPAAIAFVALEDWLNDGVPLVPAVARDCLRGWYVENAPAAGTWRVAGQPVDPHALALPALLAIPDSDRIVPPASALALAERLREPRLLHPPSGHIGMVVGARAKTGLWQPLLQWFKAHAA